MSVARPPRGFWLDLRTGKQWRATKLELREANRLFAKARAVERRGERPRFSGKPPKPKPAPVAKSKRPRRRKPDCARCREVPSVRDGLCGWCWLKAWKAGEVDW